VRVVDVKDTASETRSHLTSVVAVHAEGASLAEGLVAVGELTEAASSEDRWVSGLEVSVDDQASVVHEAVIVNGLEYVGVDIAMSAGDKHASLKL